MDTLYKTKAKFHKTHAGIKYNMFSMRHYENNPLVKPVSRTI